MYFSIFESGEVIIHKQKGYTGYKVRNGAMLTKVCQAYSEWLVGFLYIKKFVLHLQQMCLKYENLSIGKLQKSTSFQPQGVYWMNLLFILDAEHNPCTKYNPDKEWS